MVSKKFPYSVPYCALRKSPRKPLSGLTLVGSRVLHCPEILARRPDDTLRLLRRNFPHRLDVIDRILALLSGVRVPE